MIRALINFYESLGFEGLLLFIGLFIVLWRICINIFKVTESNTALAATCISFVVMLLVVSTGVPIVGYMARDQIHQDNLQMQEDCKKKIISYFGSEENAKLLLQPVVDTINMVID